MYIYDVQTSLEKKIATGTCVMLCLISNKRIRREAGSVQAWDLNCQAVLLGGPESISSGCDQRYYGLTVLTVYNRLRNCSVTT